MRGAAFQNQVATGPLRFQSLGIAARLGIACAAVLALIVATTYLAGQSGRRAASQVALIEALYAPVARLAQSMVDSISQFNQTVIELSNPEAKRDPRRVDAAFSRMSSHATRYVELKPGSDALMADYLGRVAAHELRARELLLLADRRRTAIQLYWRDFAQLDKAVHAAEAALQQPQAQGASALSQSLGRLQDTFGAYASAGGIETEHAVAAAETGFRLAFDANARALISALGAEQTKQLQTDFENIIRARRGLVGLNNLIGAATERFRGTGTQLLAFAEEEINEPARNALSEAAMDANRVSGSVNQTLWQLGLVTFSIMLLISVATAHGVIIPVRKLISAIRAIADGERGRRVSAEGGVYELETLATAFNEMSARLEQAEATINQYHGQLEARVDERTRQLDYLAHHDPLTRLPNRRQLAQHLNAALEAATRSGTRVGVLFLDLDNFKTINDTLGHEVGDALLNGVGERLSQGSTHSAFIARLGGDEFTVIYRDIASVDQITSRAQEMISRFQAAFELAGRRLTVSISIGAAVFPDHARDSAELLRAADAALSRAKDAGRNRCSIYGPELLKAATTRFQLEQDLRLAIEHQEFALFYQPVMSADTFELVAVEALLRWRRADGSIVLPGHFIEVAERSGLIGDISEWVLETAAQQAAAWTKGGWPKARVAVNVSPQQLLDATFHVRLESTLEKYALPPQCLEIELTETAMQTGAGTIDALHWLRSLGIGIALDDFGTGYSSLTSLQQLPLSRVKIDRSLIDDVDNNPRSASIVRSIIRLCHSLGLSVTVEGVERRAQFALLQGLAPVNVQGFLISQAVPIADIATFIAERQRDLLGISESIPAIRSDASVSDSMIVRQLRMIER